MEITGMLAIGNGEKCPYCDTVITEDVDVFKHMTDNHENKLVEALFGTNKEREQNETTNKRDNR